MRLTTIALSHFRNYPELLLDFPASGAAFIGPNGAGKSNLLEAIHLLCTGRSQRHAARPDMIAFGADAATIAGTFDGEEPSGPVRIFVGFDHERQFVLKVNEQPATGLSAWFGRAPVISLGPEDHTLIDGPPAERRRFMDMLLCQIVPGYLDHLVRYRSAVRNRGRLLAAACDPVQIDIYEESMAAHGVAVMAARRDAVALLAPLLAEYGAVISGFSDAARIEYSPSFSLENASENEWKNVFLIMLKKARKRDAETGFSSVGPQRDDLTVTINEKPARCFGSQGQMRSLALALRCASAGYLDRHKGGSIILLVDDAFAELDEERSARIGSLLAGKGQIFFASPSLRMPLPDGMPRYGIREGTISAP
jgi:DNA replication and repair protein RecF